MITKKYKDYYQELKSKRFSIFKSSVVMDYSDKGYCLMTDEPTVIIFIDSRMPYIAQLITLAHEYGHLADYENETFVKREHPASEKEANATAIKILKQFGITKLQYKIMYVLYGKSGLKGLKYF